MRRFSFRKVASAEEDDDEDVEAEEEEFLDGDYHYNKIATSLIGPRQSFRRSFHRSTSALSSAFSYVGSRKSFSYDKLGQVPSQLTIVKLDGSSFEIDVRKMATIAELKQAVEKKFSHLPTKGPGKISWRHVWGHFCLSYHGQKLLHDSHCMKDYAIKDGDRLLFGRHVSIAYNLIKKRSNKRIQAPEPITIAENNEVDNKRPEVNEDVEDLTSQQYTYEGTRKIRRRPWGFKVSRWIRWLL